jgi:O-6-methylguanine DNA methyltransferase
MKTERVEQLIETRDGIFSARYSELGLVELNFPKSAAKEKSASARGTGGPASTDNESAPHHRQAAAWHRLAAAALKKVLAGKAPENLPPLDWTGSTEFQQAVWRQMLKLRPGQTLSYAEIAQAIGRPKAVRAVGGACGANPIPVLVPCHRILAANRKIGGFSGGLDWKRRLLANEGVAL